MAGGLTTPVSLRNAFITLNNTFEAMRGTVSTDLMTLVKKVPVTDSFGTYAWLGGFPKFREWIGPRAVQGLKARVYTMYTKSYELTIGIDRDTLDDSKLVESNMIVAGMAEEAQNLYRDLVIDLLVNGQTRVAYDGQYFFDTDHSTDVDLGAGTQSNYEASGFALTRANFIAARARMRGYRGENGRPFGVGNSGGLALVVPQGLEQAAIDIVTIDNIAIAGGVQVNTLKGAARLIVVPELDQYSTTAWYLFDTAGTPPPFILQERQAPRFQTKTGPLEENVFWHKEYIWGADTRLGAGYGAWQKSFKGVA